MKTGIYSEAYFSFSDPEKGLLQMKEDGFDCVDFQDLMHTDLPLFTEEIPQLEKRMKRVSAAANNAGIEISQTHGPWRFPPCDATKEDRAERFDKMERAIVATSLLGCPYMVIHPLMPFGVAEERQPQEVWEINLDFFSRLAEKAKENGVILCPENMPFPALSLSSPTDILRFVSELDSPSVKVCLDVGHAALFRSPAEAVRKIGKERLAVLHVHDNNGRHDLHRLPCQGVVDWRSFVLSLKEIGFDGAFSLECMIGGNFPPEVRRQMNRATARLASSLASIGD